MHSLRGRHPAGVPWIRAAGRARRDPNTQLSIVSGSTTGTAMVRYRAFPAHARAALS
jgi:hypothetical protein